MSPSAWRDFYGACFFVGVFCVIGAVAMWSVSVALLLFGVFLVAYAAAGFKVVREMQERPPAPEGE